MTSLHLNWGWVNTLVSVTAIATGLSQLVQVLIPRAYAAIEKLKQQAQDRTADEIRAIEDDALNISLNRAVETSSS